MTSRLPQRYSRYLLIAAFAIAYFTFSEATGFGDGAKAWLLGHPLAHVALRVVLALLFVGAGVAWLLDPARTPDGRVKLLSRVWMLIAFAIAALQLSVLIFPTLFQL